MADDPEDFEARWAQIVAQLQGGSDPDGSDPDGLPDGSRSGAGRDGPGSGSGADGPVGHDPVAGDQVAGDPDAHDPIGGDPVAGGSARGAPAAGTPAPAQDAGVDDRLAALFEPLRAARPEPRPADQQIRQGGDPDLPAGPDTWSDEGHFVPPPPPELPEGTPVTRLAWAGTLGGPAVMLGSAMLGWDAPRVVMVGAGLAFLAGFVTLVWQLPDSRDDGWDDGARL